MHIHFENAISMIKNIKGIALQFLSEFTVVNASTVTENCRSNTINFRSDGRFKIRTFVISTRARLQVLLNFTQQLLVETVYR